MENQAPKKRRIYPWIALALFAVVLMALLYLLFIPHDLTRFAPRIEAYVEERVAGDVSLGRIVVKALPAPDIAVTDASISYAGEKIFSFQRLRARLEFLPLLKGTAVFERLELEKPDLLLKRDKDGELNISKFLESRKPEEKEGIADEKNDDGPEEEKKEKKLYIKTLDLRGGRARFIDELPPGGAAFEVAGLNAMLERTPSGYTFGSEGTLAPSTPLAFSGKVSEKGEITGLGSVEGLALSRFNPYIRMSSPGASIEGRMDLDLAYEYDGNDVVAALVSYRGLEASFPSMLSRNIKSPSGRARVSVSPRQGGSSTDISAEEITLNAEGFTLTGSFSLTGPEKDRSFSLLASTTPIELSTIKALLPLRKMPGKTAETISGIEPLSGSVTLSRLKADGKASELKGARLIKRPGGVELSASVDGASFRLKGREEAFREISGKLSFRDSRLDLAGVTVAYGKETIERLDGWIKDLTGKAPFEATLTGSLDVNETLGIATGLARGGLKERLSKAAAAGTVNFQTSVAGSLKDRGPYRYSGEASIADGALTYEGLPLSIDYLDARASFDQDRVRIIESNAATGQSRLSVTGTVEGYRGKEPVFNIDAKGSVAEDTLRTLAKKTPDEVEIEGGLPFAVSASGTPQAFKAKANVDATKPRFFYEDTIDKKAGFPLKFSAELERRGSDTTIHGARLDFGTSSVNASGTLTNGRKAYSLSIVSEQILIADLDEVSPFLNKEYASSGAITLNIKTSKDAPEARAHYEGQLAMRDGKFSTRAVPAPIENVNLNADFSGNKGSFDIENLSTGATSMNGRVDVLDMDRRTVSFDINFPTLHSADLIKKKKKEDKKKTEEEEKEEEKEEEAKKEARKEAAKINGTGRIRAVEGDLWGHGFKSLETGAILGNRVIQLYPLHVNVDGGAANGSFSYFLDDAEPLLFTADLKFTGVDIQAMLAAFGNKKRVLSGDLRADVLLSATRGVKPVARGMNGYVNIATGKGRLWKFGFLSDIFSIVNIISIDELFESGLQHKGIDGHFNMVDGVLTTEDLVMDSDTLRMSAVGEIDTAASTIYATLALHPFVTIDKIISNIPLAGWIITGEKESAVSLYFEMEGPLKDPDVMPLPVESMTENIFGILERLIRAPLKIFE